MDTSQLISGAAHVVTVSSIIIYCFLYLGSKKRNLPLLCLNLLGPLAGLLVVLNASNVAAFYSRFTITVSTVHVHLAAVMFIIFHEVLYYTLSKSKKNNQTQND